VIINLLIQEAMISEHYHTNACKTDDAFTALMPTKRSKIFHQNFLGHYPYTYLQYSCFWW